MYKRIQFFLQTSWYYIFWYWCFFLFTCIFTSALALIERLLLLIKIAKLR